MNIKSKFALLKRWMKMLTGSSVCAVRQGVGQMYNKSELRGYYNDLTGKIGEESLLDEEGIPLTKLGDGTACHFPIVVFQYGLGLYDLNLQESTEEMRAKIQVIAEWAIATQRKDGSWDCFTPIKSKKYTVSSMCQGEGASFLLRAAKLFDEKIYEEAAFAAVDFMLKDISDGGTACYENNGLYLEEYPQVPRRSVMNGWIFSLFGLYDAMLIKPEKYGKLFQLSVKTLSESLNQYDKGYWSCYDRNGLLASPAYHDLHVALLTVLSDLTGMTCFEEKAKKYDGYQKCARNRSRAILVKIGQKLHEETDFVIVQ